MPDQQVTIVGWPKEPAKLAHEFNQSSPCPVTVSFETTPAQVALHFPKGERMQVDMNMALAVRRQIPVCIRLCEPICASSDYTIGINVFDTPVFSVRLKGLTRLFNCRDQSAPTTRPEQTCVDFTARKVGEQFDAAFSVGDVTFAPLAGGLQIANFGDPQGQPKLEFPADGVRISFAQPVGEVRVTLCNYPSSKEYDHVDTSGQSVAFRVVGSDGPSTVNATIANAADEVVLSGNDISSVEVRHGASRAALVRVCYTPDSGMTVLSSCV